MLHDDVIYMSLRCPGHAALIALERAITSLILSGPLTMCFQCIGCIFMFSYLNNKGTPDVPLALRHTQSRDVQQSVKGARKNSLRY